MSDFAIFICAVTGLVVAIGWLLVKAADRNVEDDYSDLNDWQ